MKHLDLFSGIGGFAIATERVWPNTEHLFCEIDPFCQAVLKKHWPNTEIYADIRQLTTDAERQRELQQKREQQEERGWIGDVDILTGGFPCQPASQAGLRKGTGDARWLWPEMLRVIQEFSPRWVVGENVRGLLSLGGGMEFEKICLDLEALGYEVQPFILPAVAVGAPHRRDRVWIIAHAKSQRGGRLSSEKRGVQEWELESAEPQGGQIRSESEGRDRGNESSADPDARRLQRHERASTQERPAPRGGASRFDGWGENWVEVAARLCGVDDGLPSGLPRPRGWRNAALKAYGNAIVPQVAEQIFTAIKRYEHSINY
jgi:DNA (cytosine-5)-methyltransferase 1